jgi:hypothetical protein
MEFFQSTHYVCQYSKKGKVFFFVFDSGVREEFYTEVYYQSNILGDILLIGIVTTSSCDYNVVKEYVENLLDLESCKNIIWSIENGSQQIVSKNKMDVLSGVENKFSLN